MKRFIQKAMPYRYIEQIGEGAYGVTYLLEHELTKQRVVLKYLKSKHLHKRGRKRFSNEIDYMKQLAHLPIPKFLDEGMVKGVPFYVMSYVHGETFEQAIFENDRIFTIQETLKIAHKLLLLLTQMHQANIVHRDLRIPNILIKDEQLTIIDFGLAATIDPNFKLQKRSNFKKTPHPISDLVALGHVLLFLLYSQYEPTTKKSTSWQLELKLPSNVQQFIERLLTIGVPFESAKEANESVLLLLEKK